MTTAEKVNHIIIDKLGVNPDDIKPESNFTDDLGADSLDKVELIMEIETGFQIKIEDTEMEGIMTVQDAVRMIEAKLEIKNNS